MVLGLFGKKSDHPLADIKTAQQLLDDIPKTDSLKALQELTEWIELIREHANDFKLDHQWTVLRMFDQAAQSHVRKLLHDYFTLQALSKFQENRLWALLDVFYTQSELCYYDVFTRYRDGAKGASAVKSARVASPLTRGASRCQPLVMRSSIPHCGGMSLLFIVMPRPKVSS